jgi:hypothetical protein
MDNLVLNFKDFLDCQIFVLAFQKKKNLEKSKISLSINSLKNSKYFENLIKNS